MAGLTPREALVKRGFDLLVSIAGLIVAGWIILLAAVAATLDTGRCGLFTQVRVGRHGRPFKVIKIRTMRPIDGVQTNVTTDDDARITTLGRLLRKLKLDELPQLLNVVAGQMSLVGPRPDVPGFADRLEAGDRIILSVRPGITGPATLKYRDEESLLAAQDDPEAYNRDVIFPDKVRINVDYVMHWSLGRDLRCIWRTVAGGSEV